MNKQENLNIEIRRVLALAHDCIEQLMNDNIKLRCQVRRAGFEIFLVFIVGVMFGFYLGALS